MYAAEMLIERLREQIELAPQMRANTTPGGSIKEMTDRLIEGMNFASHVDSLKAVEAGPRRYAAHFNRARTHVQTMAPLLDQMQVTQEATYIDGMSKEKAIGRLKELPAKVIACCKAAIAELEGALQVLEEGEGKKVKQTAGAR